MKSCPKCGKQYSDPTLNFCLDDGSVLVAQEFSDEQTILINQTRDTEPRQPVPMTMPSAQPAWNVDATAGGAKKKSSKMWIVVLLLFGGIVFVCFGGIGGLVYIQNQKTAVANTDADNRKPTPPPANAVETPASQRTDEKVIDLTKWGQNTKDLGTTEFVDGELQMASNKKGYYYVLIARQGSGRTNNADTSLKVRNIDAKATNVGYGLVIHSSPTPLDKDYAFLIDTIGQRYKIVYHLAKKETVLVDWTKSNAVKGGSEENVLEARDANNKIELYINGTMVTSIRNVHGHAVGVPGLYSGDGINIGFKDLTVRR